MDASGRVKQLRSDLEHALELLDGGTADEKHLLRAWSRCDASFQALGELSALRAIVNADDTGQLELELQLVSRLYAFAGEAITSGRERMVELLKRAREERRRFSFYVPAPPTGNSCDRSG